MSFVNCTSVTPDCPVSGTIYGYYPSLSANIAFLTLFSILALPTFLLTIYHRTWFYGIAMTLAATGELLGYIGRVMMHSNPWSKTAIDIQICCLIIAPAFNSAALYLILKHVCLVFGKEYSRIRPSLYTWCFISGDVLSLVLQAIGGGQAAANPGNANDAKTGDYIMLAGIVWQVVTLLVFGAFACDFVHRRSLAVGLGKGLDEKAEEILRSGTFRAFVGAMVVAWLCVFIRCVYRIAEMANGWQNSVMENEGLFIAFDGCMIVIATTMQTVFHPGFCFPVLSSKFAKSHYNNDSDAQMEKTLDSKEGSEPVI